MAQRTAKVARLQRERRLEAPPVRLQALLRAARRLREAPQLQELALVVQHPAMAGLAQELLKDQALLLGPAAQRLAHLLVLEPMELAALQRTPAPEPGPPPPRSGPRAMTRS